MSPLWSSIWRHCGTGAVLGRWSTLFNPSLKRQQMFDYVSGGLSAVRFAGEGADADHLALKNLKNTREQPPLFSCV
jgi:hypothetical protein